MKAQCEPRDWYGFIANYPFSDQQRQLSENPEFNAVLLDYSRRFAWELAQQVTEKDFERFLYFHELAGARFVVQACEHIERYGVKAIGQRTWYHEVRVRNTQSWKPNIECALYRMASIRRLDPEDDPETLVVALARFCPNTLKMVLAATTAVEALILRAMGHGELASLWKFVLTLGEYVPPDGWLRSSDLYNSPDPSHGVMDLLAFRKLVSEGGEARVKDTIKLIREVKIKLPNTLQMIEAAMGWNREQVLAKLPKRNQPALKAYGLLPLRNGQDECLERYLFLRQFQKESKQFGPQRQASESAAAQAALANLAQVAGYADATRLEWAMEALLARQVDASEHSTQVDDYQVTLRQDDGEPVIVVYSGDRALKSIPDAVRKSDAYKRLRETQDTLRAQATRFRHALEDAMINDDLLSAEELDALCRLPAVRPLLGRLIFQVDDGAFGLFTPETREFFDIRGQRLPPPAQVRIAHTQRLFHAGQLADWQREVVRRRLVQPFKQAFRELYVLTPAEEETLVISTRFAGHLLDPRTVTRLFQARGWHLGNAGDYDPPAKTFSRAGVEAVFEFPDAGHFLSETELITSDVIYFLPYPADPMSRWREEAHLPLADIPPIIFSEVMRDADLVVSVAQRGEGESSLSEEAYLRRGELVTTLLEDMGLPNVTIDGHFARIRGKLAQYRIHLGSAAIHIEPGNYLCIVPDRWGKTHEKLFLPFADQGDLKFSEVVSKILLLVNDENITDGSILTQIAGAINVR